MLRLSRSRAAPCSHPVFAMSSVLNISCYKFIPLPDAEAWRERLERECLARGLLGTILLAEEGINCFLAGEAEAIHAVMAMLRADVRFADLAPKESWSDAAPFKKMRVRVKREIIRMDHPTIRPASGRAPAISPATLHRWLQQGHDDEGRPVVTLDTRNDYEVNAGAFVGALDWRLTKFTEFPAQLRARKAELAGKTVVSYCTGGIRCEKAAILMQEEGIANVHQLDGGILKYFEETDGQGYSGGCFVFDGRRVLDDSLQKTELFGQH